MSGSPTISVIIPAYNEERHLARTLRSILRQTLSTDVYEIIVIDDCSEDNTARVLELFSTVVILLRNEKRLGLPGSLNRGIKRARGKYMVRLDADDYVRHDYLSILQQFLEDNSHMDAVACDYLEVDENENVLARRNCLEYPIGCGIMFRIDHLIDIGLYDDSFLLH
jgi:glycosyltransferase involved in cell wall biosynthesis